MRYWRSIIYYDHEPSRCAIVVAANQLEAQTLLADHVKGLGAEEDPERHYADMVSEIEGPLIIAWPEDPFEIGIPK